jgi:protein phosphatase
MDSPTSDHYPSGKYPFKQYVWALGEGVRDIPRGQRVDERYEVVSACIWLDTQAEQLPKFPETIPAFAQPYLQAYPYQLHLPGIYGLCHKADGEPVLLLNNIPVDRGGKLFPTLHQAWETATPFRQAYWCWQLIELWTQLSKLGVAASLLKSSNLRVESWRVRLIAFTSNPPGPSLDDLSAVWSTLIPTAHPPVAQTLKTVCAQMQAEIVDLDEIADQLNQLLLTQAQSLALNLQVAGGTSAGPQQPRNEDACYPSQAEFQRTRTADLPALPRIAIVCDGVGGHAGGEIASQTVVRSLQLQLRGLIAEVAEQQEPIPPTVVMEQIEAAIRVANNLVANQNDAQGRAERERMATTLVAALQLPQRIPTENGFEEVNELYLAHVGDSRAYWITPEYCHQLTVDDDIAGREVTAGHSLLPKARQRPDAGALTQAIGAREADFLTPHIQRFILDETGVLLLCSDGLSDHRRVEESWANYIGLIVKNIVPLPSAVDSWIELAHQRNGHDDVAVVLMHCQVTTTDVPTPVTSRPIGQLATQQDNLATELTEASKALLYGEAEMEETIPSEPLDDGKPGWSLQPLMTAILTVISLSILGIAGFFLWETFKPQGSPVPELPPTDTP